MIFFALSGGIAGNSLFAWFAELAGWRMGLIYIAIIGLFCLLFMVLACHDNEMIISQRQRFKFILSRHAILAELNLGILNAPIFVLGSLFGNQYLIREHHLNISQAASVSSLMFAGMMFGSPLIGYLADKFGHKLILFAGYSWE